MKRTDDKSGRAARWPKSWTLGAACLPAIGTVVWVLCGPDTARAEDSAALAWQATFVTRLEALALLQTFNADLLSHDSATATLERWCGVHHLAPAPRIVAVRVDAALAPSPEQRLDLAVLPGQTVGHRRVRLVCGARVLSEADNWYVPGRLTDQMNRTLTTTDTPFGKVVQPLHFHRRTLSAELLWSPLPEAWEMNGAVVGGELAPMPAMLLRHRALLTLPDGTPISEVVETYTSEILDFPPLRR